MEEDIDRLNSILLYSEELLKGEGYDIIVDVNMNLRDVEALKNVLVDYAEKKLELEFYYSRIKLLEAENKALKMNLGIVTDEDMKHIPFID